MCRKTVVQLVVTTAEVCEHDPEAGTADGEHPRALSSVYRRRQFHLQNAPAVHVQGEGVERLERLREVSRQEQHHMLSEGRDVQRYGERGHGHDQLRVDRQRQSGVQQAAANDLPLQHRV